MLFNLFLKYINFIPYDVHYKYHDHNHNIYELIMRNLKKYDII